MTALSWFDLSKVEAGTRVRFVEDFDIFPQTMVKAGSLATVIDNWLNEMHCSIHVLTDDREVRIALADWDGEVILGSHLNPGVDLERPEGEYGEDEMAWFELSPLEVI